MQNLKSGQQHRAQQYQHGKKQKAHKYKNTISFLQQGLENNAAAMNDGPRVKHWTKHDLRNIKPLTVAQQDLFESFFNGDQICAYGSAGTGKSYSIIWLSLSELFREDSKQNRIIIVRSCVPTRDVGFLPGTLEEKEAPYESPYIDIFSDICGKYTTYEDMKKAGIVEFTTTANIRGVSWNDAIVVIDEAQNMTIGELNTLMGRIGKNTRVMVLGDVCQNDLVKRKGDESGFPVFLKIIDTMPEFNKVQFTRDDIVRSNFCKSWICALEDYFAKVV